MKTPTLLALAAVTLTLPACSMLTSSGRQEAAYARYVRKSSKGRVTQQRMFHSGQPAMPVTQPTEPSEPVESAGPVAVAENVP